MPFSGILPVAPSLPRGHPPLLPSLPRPVRVVLCEGWTPGRGMMRVQMAIRPSQPSCAPRQCLGPWFSAHCCCRPLGRLLSHDCTPSSHRKEVGVLTGGSLSFHLHDGALSSQRPSYMATGATVLDLTTPLTPRPFRVAAEVLTDMLSDHTGALWLTYSGPVAAGCHRQVVDHWLASTPWPSSDLAPPGAAEGVKLCNLDMQGEPTSHKGKV